MGLRTGDTWPLIKQTVVEWIDDEALQLGAALAFYTALSIAPLLVISLRIVASVFDIEAARGEIERQAESMVGQKGAEAIQAMLESASQPGSGTVATILSVATLLFGASGVFGQLQLSLNRIWEVQPKAGRGIWGVVRDRFLSMVMVMGIAFLLLVSLVLSAVLAFVGGFLDRLPDRFHILSQALNFVGSFAVITALFAMMFKFLPDVRTKWWDVWLGAFITALLFNLGKFGIGLYLGGSGLASSYGVAGSFVVLLVWVYYSSLILFFGAELTQVYANRYGSRIVPSPHAELTSDEARARAAMPDDVTAPMGV